ncbi:MbnP family protein [Winogradskyella litorisediminis]|uniref:MbnP family protein n=1 Tax=Winogradskyella litorisediminis TaxID=1156618 RepID=A0ABW3N4V1_9FLAO
MKKTLALLLIILLFSNCEDNDDNLSMVDVAFEFSHTWENDEINANNLTSIVVTNENGEVMNIARIRYLISRIELTNENGTTYSFNGYKFTDLSDVSTYNFTPDNNRIPSGNYTLKFVWGFNEEDNIDGEYLDLNSASWNWPTMLGGGYHFLQFDGQYNINTSPSSFNFHNGTARVSTNPNVFEQNFAEIEFATTIEISNNASIEVVMDFSEFFKTPHTWDLNVLDTPLMPNYNAQKMMQANVQSVFSIGTITQ